MQDGDYHDIWFAVAFAVPVLLLGMMLFEGGEAGQVLTIVVAVGGATIIRERIARREQRKHSEGD